MSSLKAFFMDEIAGARHSTSRTVGQLNMPCRVHVAFGHTERANTWSMEPQNTCPEIFLRPQLITQVCCEPILCFSTNFIWHLMSDLRVVIVRVHKPTAASPPRTRLIGMSRWSDFNEGKAGALNCCLFWKYSDFELIFRLSVKRISFSFSISLLHCPAPSIEGQQACVLQKKKPPQHLMNVASSPPQMETIEILWVLKCFLRNFPFPFF